MSTNTPSVLVAYDGSPDAELALHWGIDAAERTGSALRVIVIAEVPEQVHEKYRAQVERWVDTTVARARVGVGQVATPVEVEVERGSTLPLLLAASAEVDVLVVGSRGHSLWESGWIGSTSQHLAALAECTVVVARAKHNPHSTRIVVGLDGSPASRRALRSAAARASVTGEEVLAVHAYQHFSLVEGGRTGALAQDIDTETVDAAERLAAELVAGVVVDFPDVVLRSSAVVGRAGHVLSNLAEDASLVVVGSRGRSPLKALVLGSVSQEVLHKAACPVAVVR